MARVKNLHHFPHSVRVNVDVVHHKTLRETDELLIKVHKFHAFRFLVVFLIAVSAGVPILWDGYFNEKVRLGYTLESNDISMLDKTELTSLLKNKTGSFIMEIPSQNATMQNGQGKILIKSEDVSVTYDPEKSAELLFGDKTGTPYSRFFSDLRRTVSKEEIPRMFVFDENKFNESAKIVHELLNWPYKDAYVAFIDGKFQAYPEIAGNTISEQAARTALAEAFRYGKTKFEPVSQKVPAKVVLDEAKTAAAQATTLIDTDITLTVIGKKVQPTLQEKSLWVNFKTTKDDSLAPYLDKNLLGIWVDSINQKYKTSARSIDQEKAVKQIISALKGSDSAAHIELPTLAGLRTPPRTWKKYIEVNLTKQRMYAIYNGKVKHKAGTVTGAPATPTRPGIFKIYQRQVGKYFATPDGFRGYSKYWMRFDDGRGLHDANWRTKAMFGNPAIRRCCGSHGCVNLPIPTAKWLYAWSRMGTPVWVHY